MPAREGRLKELAWLMWWFIIEHEMGYILHIVLARMSRTATQTCRLKHGSDELDKTAVPCPTNCFF